MTRLKSISLRLIKVSVCVLSPVAHTWNFVRKGVRREAPAPDHKAQNLQTA